MGSAGVQGPLWSGIADTWSEIMEPLRPPLYDAMLGAADLTSGTSVLDAGCGSGAASKRAALRGANVAGLDAAEKNEQRAMFAAMESELPEPPKAGPFALSALGLVEDMMSKA